MKNICIAFGLGLGLLLAVPSPASAQKIIVINGSSGATSGLARTPVRVVKFGHRVSGRFARKGVRRKSRLARVRLVALALPNQTLFPPYYRFPQPYAQGPDMKSRIRGGKTVRQGSPWRGHIKGGRTVEGGSPLRSHIKGGRTSQGGSRWASHIVAGRTVEQGSPWRSTMPNWRFSGYAAPVRPKGIAYYRTRRARAPWASR